ncbi:cation transporter [Shewanella sp. WXL01]|uniref:cation transporter n=1 Tax=Shewanella sp. WXL01 TaxID=2709721 RepID=UPI00143842FB|nr:cation transporter [Shewanella sp. WXL01]NKF52274.1 cation transporter [Shewanella sp. WXL01]
MSYSSNTSEFRLLSVSAVVSSGFAVGGVVFGIIVGSTVIMFDGAYSLVGLLLTLLSLAAASQLKKPSSQLAKHGRTKVEAVVIVIKASVLLGLLLISLYSAVSAMLAGGRPVNASVAVIFGVLNLVGCCLAWLYLSRQHKSKGSKLIGVEIVQWKMDAIISFGVLVGFTLAWSISLTPWAELSVYADPLMMIVISVSFMKVPALMLSNAYATLIAKKAKQLEAV